MKSTVSTAVFRRDGARTRCLMRMGAQPLYQQRSRQRLMISSSSARSAPRTKDPQLAAYDFYRRQREQNRLIPPDSWLGKLLFSKKKKKKPIQGDMPHVSREESNARVAWYSAAIVVGALGATYAAVPLYKVFCQTTGFGGTTQRVLMSGDLENETFVENIWRQAKIWMLSATAKLTGTAGSGTRVHSWTDEDAAKRLATLKPVEGHELITVRFDTTVNDILPWSFVPVQLDVKVVPGETALSFFRVTNHSDKAITGVATYNVHPPKVGLYFQKIQCFCFEEQRLLPGETVDMPVFFFIDPDFVKDPQCSYVRSVTLSYTFFQTDADTDYDDDDDDDDDDDEKSGSRGRAQSG